MSFGNIVNQFHNKYSLPDTCTTKKPNFSSPLIWCKKINNLNNEHNIVHMVNIWIIYKLYSIKKKKIKQALFQKGWWWKDKQYIDNNQLDKIP